MQFVQVFQNPDTGTAMNGRNAQTDHLYTIFIKFQELLRDFLVLQKIVFLECDALSNRSVILYCKAPTRVPYLLRDLNDNKNYGI